jgi:hypothetical protein
MTTRRLLQTLVGAVALSALAVCANAQVAEETAREQARNVVRSDLQSALHFKPEQFLGVQREEALEQLLSVALRTRARPWFIYRVSPDGDEVKEGAVVSHISMDGEFEYIIAVSPADGSTYRIHGFGFTDSLAEFEKLIIASKVRVSSPEQAESLTDFYREVNPENYSSLTPILSLMELKQAGERQCQGRAKSFDADEGAFAAWWKHAQKLYATLSFEEKAIAHGSGFVVEWIILSSPSGENCGGSPLLARLEVGPDGQVGKRTISPLQTSRQISLAGRR